MCLHPARTDFLGGREKDANGHQEIRISEDFAEFLPPDHGTGGGQAEASGRGLGVPELLTVEQAAEVLNISRDHVYGLIRTGELRSIKIGKLRRISWHRITDFIRGGKPT